jgi:hypothetical protein
MRDSLGARDHDMTALVTQFTTLAQVLHPRRRTLFAGAIAIAAVTALVLTQSSHMSARVVFGAVGLAGLALVWTWGGFLVTAWFGPNSRVSASFKPLTAVFLILWFLVGSIGFVLYLWSVLFAGA